MAGGAEEHDSGKEMKLWVKVVIGLVLGIIVGLTANNMGFGSYTEYVKPIGTIFINLIKMVVVPLIFFSLIAGITSMNDTKTLSRVGIKAIVLYMSTVCFAIIIGIVLANLMEPGKGITIPHSGNGAPSAPAKEVSIGKILMDIVPTNGIGAMAEGHILQVVFFAVFVGLTLAVMGDRARRIIEICHDSAQVTFKMIGIIIRMSPYAVFALIAWVIGTQGPEILKSLAMLVGTVVSACFIQYLIFGLLIMVFTRLSPLPFYRKSLEYQSLAFSTSSSKATLATTMYVAEHKMGVSKPTTSFVLPLGAAINMDGTAIYLAICTVFISEIYGVPLGMHDYLLIILTATIGSIGAAGYPGGSLVMLPLVLTTVNLPLEGIGLILGIDRILDMLRTTINITGDATITLIVDKTEGKLDEKQYYS